MSAVFSMFRRRPSHSEQALIDLTRNLELCDAAGVSLWKRRSGWAWATAQTLAAGDVLSVRPGFLFLSDAAADAVAVLGLGNRH